VLIAWAAFALSLGLTSFPSGEMVPVCIAALLFAALCAQRGRLELSAVAIAVAMVEPQIALPAAIAFIVRYTAFRPIGILVLAGALFAMGSLVAGGLWTNLQYLTSVIPAHALAEVSRDNQYSLSTILSALGLADGPAVAAGTISYAVMLVAGVYLALRLANRYYEPGFVVLVPPAVTLAGGSFVHTVEFAAAIPACLLLFTRATEDRKLMLLALVLLSVPWMMATSAAMFLAPIFPVAYLVYVLSAKRRTLALASGTACLAALAVLFALASQPASHVAAHVTHPFIDPHLAQAAWRTLVLGNSTNRTVTWLLRLPTWIGLLAFIAAAIRSLPKSDLVLARTSHV
jgi:hypothetical protein